MIKKWRPVLLLLALLGGLLAAPLTASAYQGRPPQRVAIMPAVQLRGQRDLDVVKLLDDKLTGAFHIPLNDTLQIYEYVGRDELAASCHIVREARYKIDETVARNAAAAVTADRWAVFVIENLEEYMRMSFSFDYNDILLSEVKLRLIVYDRERDVYNEYRGRAYYRDEYSPAGTAYALADDLADKLLKKADLTGRRISVAAKVWRHRVIC